MPGMVCHKRLEEVPSPARIEVRTITADQDQRAFIAVLDLAYTSLGMPAGVFSSILPQHADVLPPHVEAVGAFENGALLSGAQVVFSHGIAGVYSVGTAAEARGRGLGALVTRVVTNVAFDAGAPYVTLQASPMGESIYRRMGYEELYRSVCYTRFVPEHS
jgi:ribosomal protein S18 acetylase RimI-like enzyme